MYPPHVRPQICDNKKPSQIWPKKQRFALETWRLMYAVSPPCPTPKMRIPPFKEQISPRRKPKSVEKNGPPSQKYCNFAILPKTGVGKKARRPAFWPSVSLIFVAFLDWLEGAPPPHPHKLDFAYKYAVYLRCSRRSKSSKICPAVKNVLFLRCSQLPGWINAAKIRKTWPFKNSEYGAPKNAPDDRNRVNGQQNCRASQKYCIFAILPKSGNDKKTRKSAFWPSVGLIFAQKCAL